MAEVTWIVITTSIPLQTGQLSLATPDHAAEPYLFLRTNPPNDITPCFCERI
jgi:hypothetical protein